MNEVTERITVPPIECEPWCEYQDGHPNERFREDQQCFSHHGLRVPLSLHPMIADDEPGPDGPEWEPEPDSVQVFAAKHADGGVSGVAGPRAARPSRAVAVHGRRGTAAGRGVAAGAGPGPAVTDYQ